MIRRLGWVLPLMVTAALVAGRISGWGIPDGRPVAACHPVLAGARLELQKRTRYNRQMLDVYFPPVYRDGRRQPHAVYPHGDVRPDQGICADLVVRALRHAGVDLQAAVCRDIRNHAGAYDQHTPDPFSDHRRVWILLRYFRRHFRQLPVDAHRPYDGWQAGDIVVWRTRSQAHLHIGVISDRKAPFSGRPLVIHNAPRIPLVFPGHTTEQDVLTGIVKLGMRVHRWTIIGHFRLPQAT